MLHSIDGGKTVQYVKGLHHGDHHDLWIDPKNPKRMIAANDGGVDISTNGGETWFAPPLPIGQFYHVSVDTRVPYHVAGAMQDLGTAQGPSESLRGNIALSDWHDVGGGEAGYVDLGRQRSRTSCMPASTSGSSRATTIAPANRRNVSAWPENPSGHGGEDMKYRFQWTAPIAASPHDPKVDLSRRAGHLPHDQRRPELGRHQPRSHAQRQVEAEMVGRTDHGRQHGRRDLRHRLRDRRVAEAERPDLGRQRRRARARHARRRSELDQRHGGAWPALPEWGTVSMHRAFPVRCRHRLRRGRRASARQHAAVSLQDDGPTGRRGNGSTRKLPQDVYLHAVREDPKKTRTAVPRHRARRDVLDRRRCRTWRDAASSICRRSPFTTSSSRTTTWSSATHGRSLWILDDLRPDPRLRREDRARRTSTCFPLPTPSGGVSAATSTARARRAFSNPPSGASIYYFLKEKPKGELKIEILDRRRIGRADAEQRAARTRWTARDNEDPEDSKKAGARRSSRNTAAVVGSGMGGGDEDQRRQDRHGRSAEGPACGTGPYTVRL